MNKLKIMVVTTSRADYGLLHPLLKKLHEDSYFDFSLIVTGSHLAAAHGNTIDIIKKDGFPIADTIEMTMQSDTEHAICTSIGVGMSGFSHLFKVNTPDALIVLGDRYELVSAAVAALVHKIPIVHIHGGEVTMGAIDDPIRHSISKMASVHFPSIDLYGQHIVQMGEDPARVFVVGALGIDNIKTIPLMTREELTQFSGADFSRDIALMTYHPVTMDDYAENHLQIQEILEALLPFELFTVITMPNADTGSNAIFTVIERYVKEYPEKFKLIKNLGQKAYLSAMEYSKLMIGNSSSGVIEAASYRLPVVNIGDRQGGRFKPQNVIDCLCVKAEISEAIQRALSKEFAESISTLINPYGDGLTASRISEALKTIDFCNKERLLKKGFYELG